MYSVVGTDGQVYGPVDMETLTQWIKEGRILPTTNLIDPLDGRTLQAQDAPVLYGMFPTASAVPPNPPRMGQAPGYYPSSSPGNQVTMNNSYQRGSLAPPKSKVVAILLAFFFGTIGVHRFYLGHIGTGAAMLLLVVCTCGFAGIITWVWSIIDLIMIATGGLKDASGQETV